MIIGFGKLDSGKVSIPHIFLNRHIRQLSVFYKIVSGFVHKFKNNGLRRIVAVFFTGA